MIERPETPLGLPDELPPNVAASRKAETGGSVILGLEILGCDAEAGLCDVAYEASDALANKWGAVHGGMVAAMMDDVMALAAGLHVEWGQIVPTLEMKVSYLSPARKGRLTARGQVIKRGKSTIFVEGALWNEDGSLAATGTSTYTLVTLKKKS